MTHAEAERLLTVEEFFRLPEPPEGGKMELVRGRAVRYMPVSGGHGRRASLLDRALGPFVDEHQLGSVLVEAGFLLARNPDVVRAPDVSFVSREMEPPDGIPDEGWVPCVPTLAIEVISPNDSPGELQEKIEDYRRAGVPCIWLVRPREQTVTVYLNGTLIRVFRPGDTLQSEDAGFALPGFSLPISRILSPA